MKKLIMFTMVLLVIDTAIGQPPPCVIGSITQTSQGSSPFCVGYYLTLTSSASGYTSLYWQRNFNNTGWSYYGGSGNNYFETLNTTGNYQYRVEVNCSGTISYSNVISIDVNNPTPAAICTDPDGLRKAIAKVSISGIPYSFSGFLINNTNNDGRLLFLTTSRPFICYSPSTSSLNNATFTWNDDLSVCTSNPTQPVTSIGCTLLVTDGNFTLLELNNAPNLATLTYLGWDLFADGWYCIFQTANSNIHKAKVTSPSSASPIQLNVSCSPETFSESFGSGGLKIATWNSGNLEQRGRGAPLISNGEKVRGVYIGGTETACGNGPSYFADLSYASSNLMQYLRIGSQTNTATVRMNYCKTNENLAGNLNQSFTYSVSGSIVSTQNVADGKTVRYDAGTFVEMDNGFVSGTDFIAEINPCVSAVTVIAAKTEDAIDEPNQRSKNLEINNDIKIYPTVVASGNAINVEVFKAMQNLGLSIYDLQGRVVQYNYVAKLNKNEPYSILLSNVSSGLYIIRAKGSSIRSTQKIIIK